MHARISIKAGQGRNHFVSFAEIDSVKPWFSQQIADPLHIKFYQAGHLSTWKLSFFNENAPLMVGKLLIQKRR